MSQGLQLFRSLARLLVVSFEPARLSFIVELNEVNLKLRWRFSPRKQASERES